MSIPGLNHPGLAIFGHKRSGKSTLARLVEHQLWTNYNLKNTVRLAFAAPLKDLCRGLLSPSCLGLSDEELKMAKSVSLSPDAEATLKHFLSEHGLPGLTEAERVELLSRMEGDPPTTWRWLMQWVGTDVVRRRDPNFWVRLLEASALAAMDSGLFVIIEDGRMANELELAEKLGFLTVGLACPANFSPDGHPTETEAFRCSLGARVFYSLPRGINVLQVAAREVMSNLLSGGKP